jgi:hypothetical protein
MTIGAALPATLLALSMTSALAVGGVYVARRHAATSAEMSAAVSLAPGVERAAVGAVIGWDSLARAEQPIGVTFPVTATPALDVWVTRTTELEYLIVAEARSETRPVLYHRIGLTVVLLDGRPRLAFPRAWSQLP